MAKPEQCSNCSKPATIHLTQIVEGKIHKIDLCETCPFKKGVTESEGFSLADFLLKAPEINQEDIERELECEVCGFTPIDFKKTGRFGCCHCYESFEEILTPMLSNMHKGDVHRGKIPEKSIARVSRQRKLDDLKKALSKTIANEEFEEAAQLRDQINEMENAMKETKSNRG